MKKVRKIVLIIIVIMIFYTLCSNVAYGLSVTKFGGTKLNNENANNLANTLISAFSVAGSAISVIVLVVIGIKYMLGSADEKAQYKKSLMPYIIGCALVFAASTIAGIIYKLSP